MPRKTAVPRRPPPLLLLRLTRATTSPPTPQSAMLMNWVGGVAGLSYVTRPASMRRVWLVARILASAGGIGGDAGGAAEVTAGAAGKKADDGVGVDAAAVRGEEAVDDLVERAVTAA